jgi:O-antigen/teichoic acid export membrane protein
MGSDRVTGDARAPHRLRRAAETDRRLLSRSSVTLFSRGFSKIAQIVFLVVAARLLTVDEFATYSYLLVLAFVFGTLSDTGVPLVASRDISAGRALPGDLFFAALPVVLISAALAGLLIPALGAVDSGPGSTTLRMLLVAAFVVFNRIFDFQATTLRGLGRFNLEAALQLGGGLVFIAGATATTAAGLGVTAVLIVMCAKESISGLIAYLALRGDLERSPTPSVRWTGLLRIGIRLSVAGISLALIMRLPLAVLGNTGTDREVAQFSAAQRFGDAAILLATTSGFALLPGIAYLAQSDRARARRLIRRVLITLAGSAAVLTLVSLPLAEFVMRTIFGSDYASGDDLLRIVLAGLPGYAALGICWYAIIAFDGEARLMGVGLAGCALSVALSLLLVPSEGATGAAWAYVGGIYAVAAFALFVLERRLSHPLDRPASADALAGLSP